MISMIILGCTCITITAFYMHYDKERSDSFDKERQQWYEERQKLIDRIQAPSFDHLKHQEAKIIKAQNEQPKEVVTLEVV